VTIERSLGRSHKGCVPSPMRSSRRETFVASPVAGLNGLRRQHIPPSAPARRRKSGTERSPSGKAEPEIAIRGSFGGPPVKQPDRFGAAHYQRENIGGRHAKTVMPEPQANRRADIGIIIYNQYAAHIGLPLFMRFIRRH